MRTLRGLLILALIALWLMPARAAGGERAMPLGEYWDLVSDTQVLAAGLESLPAEAARAQLATAADQWEAITGVTLTDGYTVPLDHSHLVRALRAEPPNPARVARLLDQLQAARLTWPSPSVGPQDLQALNEILARPEFDWRQAEPSWWDRFWLWLQESLLQLAIRLWPDSSVGAPGYLVGMLVNILGAVVFAVVVAFILKELLGSLAPEADIQAEGESSQEKITAESAFSRAQALSAGGDYRLAVRYLYLSALLLLDERGLLRYDRSLTNREYLQTVAHLPEVSATLREVVEVFDNVWYGYHALDADAFSKYSARVARLRQQR